MRRSQKKLVRLHRLVLNWYGENARRLPWRGKADPYGVLVSEVMLQQTQVNRVLIKYPQFMSLFPTLRRLASSTQREVVTAWRGMGYNNRAVRLHRLARHIIEQRNGRWPADVEGLRELPGVGRYTAHAMMVFAFRKEVPVVDVNIRRVLSRLFWKMPDTASVRDEKEIWTIARQTLPDGLAYDWNQALMDLGSSICTARAPACVRCPVRTVCASSGRMERPRGRKALPEPSRRGIPNRVFRGRIIEALRPGRSGLTLGRLGRSITSDFGPKDMPWLTSLVHALQRDGLVRISRRRNASPRVSLA